MNRVFIQIANSLLVNKTFYITTNIDTSPIISPFQIIGAMCLLVAAILSAYILFNNRSTEIKDENDEGPLVSKSSVIFYGMLLAICLSVSIFVIQFTRVESGSMEPTIMTGDYCIINKMSYISNQPQRGDIICFQSDEYGVLLIKRVIGVSGDTIEFHEGTVHINGVMLEESDYLEEGTYTYSEKSFNVPDGTIFVLGDNREKSTDSRFFDNPYISLESVIGKMILHF